MDAGAEVGHQKKFGDDLIIVVFDGHYVTRNADAFVIKFRAHLGGFECIASITAGFFIFYFLL